jgi:hypothetical protein
MTNGPYLYDDGPEPLHTSTPRRRHGLLLWVFGGTALVAALMVVLLPLVKGSPGDQSRQAVQVFLAALHKGDTDTAYSLLCEQERAHLAPGDVAARYLGDGTGSVVGTSDAEVGGGPAQRVSVEWDDGSRTTMTVINSGGPHVCGVDS